MSTGEIRKINERLIKFDIFLNFQEYSSRLYCLIYSENIEFKFLDFFIDYHDRDGFIIKHTFLFDFGVISKKKVANLKKLLFETYNFKENKDYILRKEYIKDAIGRNKLTEIYYLTQDTFKICLLRSRNENKYMRYYIFLEKILSSYNDYIKDQKNEDIKYLIKKLEDNNIESDIYTSRIKERLN